MDDNIECTLTTFVNDTKLRGKGDMPEGTATAQRRVAKLKDWTDKKYMSLNKDKYESLYPGLNNPKQQYRLWFDYLGYSSAENDLGILVDSQLNTSQQYAFTAIKANHVLSCNSKSRASSSKDVFVPHSTQDLLGWIWYCVQFGPYKFKTDI